MPFSTAFDTALMKRFTVVHWDQRHAGKSFDPNQSIEDLSVEQVVQDCIKLTEYLKKKYPEREVVLVGHSWGSLIGLLAAHKRPDLFASYIGVSQLVEPRQAIQAAYNRAVHAAQNDPTGEIQQTLNAIGKPPYVDFENAMGFSNLVLELGGILHQIDLVELQRAAEESPQYTREDFHNQGRGMMRSYEKLQPDIYEFSAKTAVRNLEIPVLFIKGSQDWLTPIEHVLDYADALRAPRIKVVELRESGHFPFWDTQEEFAKTVFDFVEKQ
jgi:pimeloyl-ACP methyl ester carboxylesterase